jgi:predicted DNA-binding protein (MmcQ/YjbR family)
MNIVTIDSSFIAEDLAQRYDLVPEQHNENNKWYKVVIMDHVEIDDLMKLVAALKEKEKSSC